MGEGVDKAGAVGMRAGAGHQEGSEVASRWTDAHSYGREQV